MWFLLYWHALVCVCRCGQSADQGAWILGVWPYGLCIDCIAKLVRESRDRRQAIEHTLVAQCDIPGDALRRLGASTLKTLPTLLELVRAGVKQTLLDAHLQTDTDPLVLSSETDMVVPASHQLQRHVPSTGGWFKIPVDIPVEMIARMPGVKVSGDKVCIAQKQHAPDMRARHGRFKFHEVSAAIDTRALRTHFRHKRARISWTIPPTIHIIEPEA